MINAAPTMTFPHAEKWPHVMPPETIPYHPATDIKNHRRIKPDLGHHLNEHYLQKERRDPKKKIQQRIFAGRHRANH